jgi:hypothetical protein
MLKAAEAKAAADAVAEAKRAQEHAAQAAQAAVSLEATD